MPMIKHCCFSKNLRAGAIACGIWTLVWCFCLLGVSVFGLTIDSDSLTDDKVLHTLVWTTLCISFLTFLSSILVITAIFKNNARLMLPWMFMVALLLLVDAASIILEISLYGFNHNVIVYLLIWLAISLINLYCELCVISHYQEVMMGRGTVHDYLGTVVRVPPAQRPETVRFNEIGGMDIQVIEDDVAVSELNYSSSLIEPDEQREELEMQEDLPGSR